MNTLYKYMGCAAIMAAGFSACIDDDYPSVNENLLPQASNYAIKATVDQETNQVTFLIDGAADGVYPVWYLDDATTPMATSNGYQRIFAQAGSHTVYASIANRNGISDGKISTTFTVDNTIMDFTKYVTLLGKGTWRMDNEAKGHMACGPSKDDAASWWSANANDKAAFGVYDNRLTFDADRNYTFDPGTSGTMYVNINSTIFDNGGSTEDFTVAVPEQTVPYDFDVEGDDLYLTFPEHTQFPYIASDDVWNNPRFWVANLSAKSMTLVSDLDGIAWQYIFTTGAAATTWAGFDANSTHNLWKSATKTVASCYYAPGWSQIADPEVELTETGMKVVLPSATTDQWQAQVHVGTDLDNQTVPTGSTYDFSCKVNSNQSFNGVTIKLVSTTNDGNFYCADRIEVAAYEEYIYYFYDVPGIDLEGAGLKIAFDFGGCPDGTEVEISDICFIDHANNTIVPPSDDEEEGEHIVWADVNSTDNIWNQVSPATLSYYYAPGWAQIADPTGVIEGNQQFSITLPEATTDQWQAQWHVGTGLTNEQLVPEELYDIKFTVTANNSFTGVTFKLTDADNDGNFLIAERVDVVAYEETTYEFGGVTVAELTGAQFKIAFDFGGAPAGTEVTVKDIVLQKHNVSGGTTGPDWDLNGESNIWLHSTASTLSYYYAPGWAQIADPTGVIEGQNKFSITLPSATTDQWQAQWHVGTGLTNADLDPEKSYDVRFTVYSNNSFTGVTFKLTDADNDGNFLLAERVDAVAYEETTYSFTGLKVDALTGAQFKIAFDFGGCPDNTEVTVSDIIIQESK